MRGLGLVVDVEPTKRLTPFDYYLPLPDVLIQAAAVSQNKYAIHLEELAHSYSHDILNLANLASRLLWFEGVTPDVWRSHDLISVDVDTSSYFVTLQTACDVMADIVATLGTRKGTAPNESFHSLTEWAKRNPNRLAEEFRLVGANIPWFQEINSVRTKLVHRGGDIWIYTDRMRFHWGVHLHRVPRKPLAKESQPDTAVQTEATKRPQKQIVDRGFLLTDLRRLTRSLLRFSSRLASCVARHQGLSHTPRKHVITGVFVPALHHIVQYYEPPKETDLLNLSARCLTVCGDYATAAYLGYPNRFWWRFLIGISEGLAIPPEVATIPIRPSDKVHDAKLVFALDGHRYGVILCDSLDPNSRWVREAGDSARKFAADYILERTVFVAQRARSDNHDLIAAACAELPAVIGTDPRRVSEQAIILLRRS